MASLNFRKYNSFNLSHDKKLTCDMGELPPVLCMEVVPGDIVRCHGNLFMRLIPQLAPFMHEVNAFMHFFFVPSRLLQTNWETFITKGFSGKENIPWAYINSGETGFTKYSLADYFGLPINEPNLEVSALPFRAYNMIVNEWYFNENVQPYIDIDLGDGLDTTTPLNIQYRNWQKDRYTNLLPFAQRGDPVYLPLGTEAPVSIAGNGIALGLTTNNDDIWSLHTSMGNEYARGAFYINDYPTNPTLPQSTTSGGPSGTPNFGVTTDPTKSGLVGTADLDSTNAVTVNMMRTAFQVQRWMERNAIGGVRYIEFLWSHFHEKTSDARLQRPEYLGGGRSVVVTNEVLQTSATDDVSPQGNMAGHSFSAQRTIGFTRRFEEFGYIIGLLSVMPKTQYQQGVHRMWTRKTPLDYYFPDFSHLGMRGVPVSELYAKGTAQDAEIFGFEPIYDELRSLVSTVSADFRDTLDYWTMTRIFNTTPQFNEDFVSAKDVTKRIFSVTNSKTCLVDIGFNIHALRKLPKHGTPGLIDHG